MRSSLSSPRTSTSYVVDPAPSCRVLMRRSSMTTRSARRHCRATRFIRVNLGLPPAREYGRVRCVASRTKTADPDVPRESAVRRPDQAPPAARQGRPAPAPDLVEKLRSGRERTLTLVCAPAGYGKTTLLAQWAAADADRTPFAWVSLDAMDSDPARLWGHVITALQEVHGRAGERSLDGVRAQGRERSPRPGFRCSSRSSPTALRSSSCSRTGTPWRAVPATRRSACSWIAPPTQSRSSSRAATTPACRSPGSAPTAT